MEQELRLATGTVCRTQIEHKIYGIVAKTLYSVEYTIVKIRMFGSGSKSVVQLMLEKNDGEAINISDCEKASKAVSAILDTYEDLIDSSYNLEIMSTGLNRPITRPEEFEKYVGHKVRVRTIVKIDGINLFMGSIVKADNKTFILKLQDAESTVVIEIANVSNANLEIIERQERVKEDKKSPEYKKKFEGKRVSKRKSGNRRLENRSSRDGDSRRESSDRRSDRSTSASSDRRPPRKPFDESRIFFNRDGDSRREGSDRRSDRSTSASGDRRPPRRFDDRPPRKPFRDKK